MHGTFVPVTIPLVLTSAKIVGWIVSTTEKCDSSRRAGQLPSRPAPGRVRSRTCTWILLDCNWFRRPPVVAATEADDPTSARSRCDRMFIPCASTPRRARTLDDSVTATKQQHQVFSLSSSFCTSSNKIFPLAVRGSPMPPAYLIIKRIKSLYASLVIRNISVFSG